MSKREQHEEMIVARKTKHEEDVPRVPLKRRVSYFCILISFVSRRTTYMHPFLLNVIDLSLWLYVSRVCYFFFCHFPPCFLLVASEQSSELRHIFFAGNLLRFEPEPTTFIAHRIVCSEYYILFTRQWQRPNRCRISFPLKSRLVYYLSCQREFRLCPHAVD